MTALAKHNKTKSKAARAFAVILICIFALGVLMPRGLSFAAESGGDADEGMIDVSAVSSLEVVDYYADAPLANAKFFVYRIADVDEYGALTPDEDFANSGVSFSSTSYASGGDNWSARAVTLETYILDQNNQGSPIAPDEIAYTDANGVAKFEGLKVGLYLVVGDSKTLEDGTIVTPNASVVSLPYYDEDGEWEYNREVEPKNDIDTPSQTFLETIDIAVVKVWDDEGHESARPSEVSVVLYKDGVYFDVVVLNADNNWRYKWYGLDETARWQLIERDVPEGYTMTSVLDEGLFTVTNTYDTPDEPGPTPTPEEPTPTPTTDTPGASSVVETLPQTGQLWWPVSALSIAGVGVFAIGWFIVWRDRRTTCR